MSLSNVDQTHAFDALQLARYLTDKIDGITDDLSRSPIHCRSKQPDLSTGVE